MLPVLVLSTCFYALSVQNFLYIPDEVEVPEQPGANAGPSQVHM